MPTPVSDCARAQIPVCASTRAQARSSLSRSRPSSGGSPDRLLSCRARFCTRCPGRSSRSWDSWAPLAQTWHRGIDWWGSPLPRLFWSSDLQKSTRSLQVDYHCHLVGRFSKICTLLSRLARACLDRPSELVQRLGLLRRRCVPRCHLWSQVFE